MLGCVTTYEESEHTLIPGELQAFLDRLIKGHGKREGKLFVVKYEEHGTFVIGEWLAGPKDIFVDVMNLGTSLSNFDKEKADELRHRLFAPITTDDVKKFGAEAESDFLHEQQDWSDGSEERVKNGVIVGEELRASPGFLK